MADFLDDINDLSMAKAIIAEQRGLIEKLESICIHTYVGLGASHDLPERFLDVLCDPVEATQKQIDALLPTVVSDRPASGIIDAVKNLLDVLGSDKFGDVVAAYCDLEREYASYTMVAGVEKVSV